MREQEVPWRQFASSRQAGDCGGMKNHVPALTGNLSDPRLKLTQAEIQGDVIRPQTWPWRNRTPVGYLYTLWWYWWAVQLHHGAYTYCMQHSPSWKANRVFAASPEIPRILWKPKVHYLFTSARHLSLSWVSSIHSIPPHPISWRSIWILSHLRLSLPSGLFTTVFPTKILYTPLMFLIRATWPTHLIFLRFITWTILGEQYRSFSSSLWCLYESVPVSQVHKKRKRCFVLLFGAGVLCDFACLFCVEVKLLHSEFIT